MGPRSPSPLVAEMGRQVQDEVRASLSNDWLQAGQPCVAPVGGKPAPVSWEDGVRAEQAAPG